MNHRDDEQHWQWENARLAARDAPSKSNHSFGSTAPAAPASSGLVRFGTYALLLLLLAALLAGCGSTELAACKGDLFSLNPPVAVPLAAGRGASL